jgi:hypothetical protein
MALDHTSLMYDAGRHGEELAALPPDIPTDILQFLTRFTGVPVAPAFCFMAGFMVALTSMRREERGISPRSDAPVDPPRTGAHCRRRRHHGPATRRDGPLLLHGAHLQFGVCLLLLAVMTWPCAWYYRKKRDRPNFITRYS